MLQTVSFNTAVKGYVLERTSASGYRLVKYFINDFGTYISKVICENLDLINYKDCESEESKEEKALRIEKIVRRRIPNLPKKIYVEEDIL